MLDPRRLELYRQDIVAFAEEQYHVTRTQLIKLADHQKRILRAIFTEPYPSEVVWSCPKKSGKTTIAGLVSTYVALVHTPEDAEVIIAANDFEQASRRVYADVVRALKHPAFAGTDIGKKVITLPTGVQIVPIASDYASAAGSRHSLSVFDELWAYTTEDARRLFHELTPILTLPFSMRFVASYAGFRDDGAAEDEQLLDSLVRRGQAGIRVFEDLPVWRSGGLFVYYDSGIEAQRMPWQQGPRAQNYLADQERSLPQNQFRRMHLNEFTGREGTFITAAQWDACVDGDHRPLMVPRGVSLVLGVDIGPRNDTSGVVGVYGTDGGAAVWTSRKWEPTPGETNIGAVEDYILGLHSTYGLAAVLYDPYQFLGSAERLRDRGLPMVEWPQTVDRLTMMGQNLLDLVRTRRLQVYDDEDLRRHVLNAVAIETARGWRIAKDKTTRKIDLAVALAMAALGLTLAPDEPVTVWIDPTTGEWTTEMPELVEISPV